MLNSHQESMVSGFSLDVSSNIRSLSFLVLLTLTVNAPYAIAERYIVADDAFGNTGAKQVSELDEDELEQLNRREIEAADNLEGASTNSSLNEPTNSTPDSLSSSPGSSAAPVAGTGGSTGRDDAALSSENSPSGSSVTKGGADDLNDPEVTSDSADLRLDGEAQLSSDAENDLAENPFERALRESQQNETDEVVKRLRAQGGDPSFDATKVNPADFVDSEDLLQGNVGSDGERPFFVTFDNEGDSNVIFYSPQVMQEEVNRRNTEEQLSDAVVYTPDNVDSELVLPEGADPVAAQFLKSGNRASYFSRFSGRCCKKIPNVGVLELRRDKGLHVPINREDFSYRFIDGDSRYRLVRLPDVGKSFLITLKTFVKSYKKQGIQHGAFIPQVVMLDRDKNITRIITNLSAESHAETWSAYGYLKSVIEVDQTGIDAETLLLVYTRADDLRRSSTVEDSSGSWEIKHMEIGSLEVTAVPSSL